MTELATINRHAVILVSTEACLAWINSCPSERSITLGELQREAAMNRRTPKGGLAPKRGFSVFLERGLASGQSPA
jgi:hypothetical protein